MTRFLLLAGAMLLAAPISVAQAHDDAYYDRDFQHRLDHLEHRRVHEDFDEAHEEAHERGFRNWREHRDWHRAEREAHEDFHGDHPNTWHDHRDAYYPVAPYGYYRSSPTYTTTFRFGW